MLSNNPPLRSIVAAESKVRFEEVLVEIFVSDLAGAQSEVPGQAAPLIDVTSQLCEVDVCRPASIFPSSSTTSASVRPFTYTGIIR